MNDKNQQEYFYLKKIQTNGLDLQIIFKEDDDMNFLLFIIKETLIIASMAAIIFSPFIVYYLILVLSFSNPEIAYLAFVGYIVSILFLKAVADYIRKTRNEKE